MLEVSDLTISVGPAAHPIDIVTDVSLTIDKGSILGMVGESGCGKSMTSLAIMGLLPKNGPRVRSGRIVLDGADITTMLPHERLAAHRGGIAMIFQEPMTSLNPVMRIGDQIAEAARVHDGLSGPALRQRALELLGMVRIPDAALQLSAYPHELSGGMRQRVMIAIALACRPKMLIADEPTTALDVTVQLQILSLLRELCDTLGMGILLITHDLGVVAQLVDAVAVMYAGRIVESANVQSLFGAPAHPYTQALMSCVPDPAAPIRRLVTIAGQAPRPGEIESGCAFVPRCPRAATDCRFDPVPRIQVAAAHEALCRYPVHQGERL